MMSFKNVECKEIKSNLNSDDLMEMIVVFGNGFTLKTTAVYLKYYEIFGKQMEQSSSSNIVSFFKLLFGTILKS